MSPTPPLHFFLNYKENKVRGEGEISAQVSVKMKIKHICN